MSFIGTFAAKMGLRERRKDDRVPTRGIEVSYVAGAEPTPVKVKNISSTGIYLSGGHDWQPDASVLLILRRKTLFDQDYGTQVLMPARVVRVGKGGVGLAFENDHIDAAGWSKLVIRAAGLSVNNDGVRVFRTAKALALVQRACPEAEAQYLKFIGDKVSYESAQRALEIVLRADELLHSQGHEPRRKTDSRLFQFIVENGLRADVGEDILVQCWGGLLASSLVEGSDDASSREFAELLMKLDATPLRILNAACDRAVAAGWEPGSTLPKPSHCSVEEAKKFAETKSLAKIGWAMGCLNDTGLMEPTAGQLSLDPITELNMTPTALGLRLYARCSGQLEPADLRIAAAGNSR